MCARVILKCGRAHKGNIDDIVYGIDQCKVIGYKSLAHDEIGLEETLEYVMRFALAFVVEGADATALGTEIRDWTGLARAALA
jgi:hypothetical protein